MQKTKTPIVFFVFNRPEPTKKVFEAIKKERPEKLYIVADGPRENKKGEKEKCAEVLKIVENIDWPCEVKRNYSETNMGCGPRVSSGIEWAFGHTNQIIVLEDDCLPNEDFFVFMETMLEKYKNNPEIGSICGFSPQIPELKEYEYSYYFSKFYYMWGWGTWKDRWNDYEYDLKSWKEKDGVNWLNEKIKDRKISRQFSRDFNNVYKNNEKEELNVNTWDFQFAYNHFKNNLFCIKPRENLIENLGVGFEDATHTKIDNPIGYMKHQKLLQPLKYPKKNGWTEKIDKKIFKKYTQKSEIFFFIKQLIKKIKPFYVISNAIYYSLLKRRSKKKDYINIY